MNEVAPEVVSSSRGAGGGREGLAPDAVSGSRGYGGER